MGGPRDRLLRGANGAEHPPSTWTRSQGSGTTRHKTSSLGAKAPSSQAGLLPSARRNGLARVPSKQSVAFSMASEIVEDGGGLCQPGWRFFSSSAAFRALGMVIPPLGRQAEGHGGGRSISGTSQQAAGAFCTPAARLTQPGQTGHSTSCGATDREPRDTGTEAEVDRAAYSPWGLTSSLGITLPSPGAAPQ